MINKEKIKELDNAKLNVLLDFIGISILRQKLIEIAKDFPPTSKYYLGKRSGLFWRGFRPEQITQSKVKMFYTHELNNENMGVVTAIMKMIALKLNTDNKEKNEIRDIILSTNNEQAIPVLFDIYEIDNAISVEELIVEKEKNKKEYLNELRLENEKFQKNIETQRNEYEKKLLEQEDIYKKRIEELNSKLKSLDNEIEKYKEMISIKEEKDNLIKNRILDKAFKYDDIFKEVNVVRLKNAISDKEDVKNVLIDLMKKNIELLENGKDITKMLVVQYIYAKMMEDN